MEVDPLLLKARKASMSSGLAASTMTAGYSLAMMSIALYQLVKKLLMAVRSVLAGSNRWSRYEESGIQMWVLTPGIVSPIVPLRVDIGKVRIEWTTLGGVDLRAVLFGVCGSHSVVADRPSFAFFTSSR